MNGTSTVGAKAVQSFEELRRAARALGAKRVAIVCAEDEVALTAAADAMRCGIASPQLVGEALKIRAKAEALGLHELLTDAQYVDAPTASEAAQKACAMASAGESDILLKGRLRTDELLHAVLGRESGLRTGRLLSDVLLYEDDLGGESRLVGVTDGGLNVAPTLEQKRQIVLNAIDVMHCLGLARPRIALMSATEMVTGSLGSTLDAAALTEMGAQGRFGEALVYGPLALDNALLMSAASAKGIKHPVAGRADCLVVPNIEAGNLLGKAVKYLRRSPGGGYAQCAHVVVGARVPVLIPSRVESPDDKVNSMALGVLFHAHSVRLKETSR